MSIALRCDGCQHEFHVNDKWAGKRIKCPECLAKVEVSAEGAGGDPLSDFMSWAGNGGQAANGAGEDDVKWYLQTFSGRQYGPVERRLLDYWQRLGAVSARSQVLREGDTQWRWASELYPQLAGPAAAVESGSGVRW
jgi:hypothetical protein